MSAVRLFVAVVAAVTLAYPCLRMASAQQVAAGPTPVVTEVHDTTATVETADSKTRQVLLRRAEGGYITMVAGPEVRNFAQIKPGDQVHARYESALAAKLGKPDETLLSDQTFSNEATALKGEKPYGEDVLELRRRITVTAVDTKANTLSFVGPDAVQRTVDVRAPQMRSFIATLKPGDQVDVSYREAMMVDVTAVQ